MKDKLSLPAFWCPLDANDSSPFLSRFPPGKSVSSRLCDEDIFFEETELKDVCSLSEDDGFVEIVKAVDEPARPFAAFGSFRQRHGDLQNSNWSATNNGVFSSEAPAKLGSVPSRRGTMPQKGLAPVKTSKTTKTRPDIVSGPIEVIKDNPSCTDNRMLRRLKTQRSYSTDIDRDEAWERKRDLFLVEEPEEESSVVPDYDDGTWTRPSRPRTKTRSLTDEDLQELKGCIDLGFGFRYDEGCDLKNTLPALELYYAINRQVGNRSSPVSPLEGVSLDRTSSAGSLNSPLSEPWRISSPGDHPSQVKTRLRHWAQAVACSVKQGFTL